MSDDPPIYEIAPDSPGANEFREFMERYREITVAGAAKYLEWVESICDDNQTRLTADHVVYVRQWLQEIRRLGDAGLLATAYASAIRGCLTTARYTLPPAIARTLSNIERGQKKANAAISRRAEKDKILARELWQQYKKEFPKRSRQQALSWINEQIKKRHYEPQDKSFKSYSGSWLNKALARPRTKSSE